MTIDEREDDLGDIEIEKTLGERIQQALSSPAAFPLALLLVNLILATGYYLIVEPMQTDVARERIVLDRAVRQIRTTLSETNAELAGMSKNPEVYRNLIEQGLTRQQDRMGAAKILDRLRVEMGLSRIQYEIDPERDIDERDFSRRGFTVVATTIRLNASTILDGDFIRFTDAVLRELPGQIQLRNLSMDREVDDIESALNAALAKRPFTMVKASAEFEWRTLKPYVKKKGA